MVSPERLEIRPMLPTGLSRAATRKIENRLALQGRYLKALARVGTVTAGLQAARVTSETLHDWRYGVNCDAFVQRETEARDTFADTLEREAIKRGREYSDQLLMFLLRGLRPERYRDRVDVSVTPVIKAVAGFDPGDVI